jgi:hypothetical protein
VISPLQITDVGISVQYEIAGVAGLLSILLGVELRNLALLNRIKSYLENRFGAKLD